MGIRFAITVIGFAGSGGDLRGITGGELQNTFVMCAVCRFLSYMRFEDRRSQSPPSGGANFHFY
jgi:hypothetical protein